MNNKAPKQNISLYNAILSAFKMLLNFPCIKVRGYLFVFVVKKKIPHPNFFCRIQIIVDKFELQTNQFLIKVHRFFQANE